LFGGTYTRSASIGEVQVKARSRLSLSHWDLLLTK
jgi:hypothetical protein